MIQDKSRVLQFTLNRTIEQVLGKRSTKMVSYCEIFTYLFKIRLSIEIDTMILLVYFGKTPFDKLRPIFCAGQLHLYFDGSRRLRGCDGLSFHQKSLDKGQFIG